MAKLFSKTRLKHLRARLKRHKTAGFTLLELLVAMFVAALVVLGLLTLSAQITEANQRDAGRSQVQQDMQAAIDYIGQDLREAVFVYNGECLQGRPTTVTDLSCPGLANSIPPEMSSGGRNPVLAFWRTSPIPDAIRALCDANAPQLASEDSTVVENNPLVQARVPCVAANSYTLVVYALDTANDRDDNGIWQGKARLVRYQLPQFRDGATDQTQQSVGYVSPLESSEFTFQQWPLTVSGGAVVNRQTNGAISPGRPTVAENPPQVLVDFVDGELARSTPIAPSCQEFGSTPAEQANSLTPLGTTNRGFYACVRGGGVVPPLPPGTPQQIVDNQDVLLVLSGNVAGYSGAFPLRAPGEPEPSERLSPVQTRVLIRGVLQKG